MQRVWLSRKWKKPYDAKYPSQGVDDWIFFRRPDDIHLEVFRASIYFLLNYSGNTQMRRKPRGSEQQRMRKVTGREKRKRNARRRNLIGTPKMDLTKGRSQKIRAKPSTVNVITTWLFHQ